MNQPNRICLHEQSDNTRVLRLSLFQELKRRNVIRVAIGYAVLSWLVAQVADLFMEAFGAPDWALKTLLMLLLIGFPVAVFFAWAFELTPEGLKREREVDRSRSITRQTGRRIDRAIIVVLVLALGYFAWDKFGARPDQASQSEQVAQVTDEASAGAESSKAALPTDKSIAVLPFVNRSRQEEDEYFTSGIHDDLLTQLAQIGSLRVISRTSVAQFKDTNLSIREIAETLGVATILEGGVQRAGNQVRINMQLIDAETDAHLWAQTFDREVTANNIFSIQTEVATAVTNAMRATLTPEEEQRIRDVPTENMAALELYFKGRAELDQRTLPSIESARLRFEEARRLDPGFALAWAGEALAIQLLSDSGSSYGDIPEEEAIAMARPLIEEAYRLAPNDPQVLGIYGLMLRGEDEFEEALEFYERSLAINPSSGEVLNWQRMAQGATGQYEAALESAARIIEVDPMSMIGLFNAIATFVNTPYDDPVRMAALLDRLEGLDKSFGLSARSLVADRHGEIVQSIKYSYLGLEHDPGRSSIRPGLANRLVNLGLVEEAHRIEPSRDELDLAWNRFDRENIIRLAKAEYEENPNNDNRIGYIFALAVAKRDWESAMELVPEAWAQVQQTGSVDPALASGFALIAKRAEYPKEMQMYRNAVVDGLRGVTESGFGGDFKLFLEFRLTLIDGRQDEAIDLAHQRIDLGWRNFVLAETPIADLLGDHPGFAGLLSRMQDAIAAERQQVLEMLCGPEPIVTEYQPAPETCAFYKPQT
jgi:TolB-like protein